MTLELFGLFLIALLLGAIGNLSMKIGLNEFTAREGELTGAASLIRAMISWRVAFGLGCFVVSSALYLFCMSKMPLSLLYPMVALNYVIVTVLSAIFLKEHIPPLRVVGLATIITGVIILSQSGKPATVEPEADLGSAGGMVSAEQPLT